MNDFLNRLIICFVLCLIKTEQNAEERPMRKVLEQFPKVFLPQIWNSLSLEIKNSCSLNSLKNKLHVDKTSMYLQFECSKSNCYSCISE